MTGHIVLVNLADPGGLLLAVLGYVTVQLLWLAPALHRKRRLARSR